MENVTSARMQSPTNKPLTKAYIIVHPVKKTIVQTAMTRKLILTSLSKSSLSQFLNLRRKKRKKSKRGC